MKIIAHAALAAGIFGHFFAAAPASAAAPAAPLSSCRAMERAGGYENAIKKAPYTSRLVFAHQLKQLRLAVKQFYGAEYQDSMTVEQADELAEGVSFSNFRDREGKVYQGVNVGFGGGNSAQYFFAYDTLELQPVVVIDGSDCVALGSEN